jgi:hypothetical protein
LALALEPLHRLAISLGLRVVAFRFEGRGPLEVGHHQIGGLQDGQIELVDRPVVVPLRSPDSPLVEERLGVVRIES